jgi:hypothetical protein
MELVDMGGGGEGKPMHAVFASSVPRAGEVIEPQAGSLMEVVAVHHLVSDLDSGRTPGHRILVPYVYLEPIEEDEDEAEGSDEEDE